MKGGYQVVATVLNDTYIWPDGRVIDRRQVEMWFIRQTVNQAGEKPPEPVAEDAEAPRTQPFYIFDTTPWVAWVQPGVPGQRGAGWVVPVLITADVVTRIVDGARHE